LTTLSQTVQEQLARPDPTGLFAAWIPQKPKHMAIKLVANYSKRLGLPGYSSHQFSVTVESELHNTDNVSIEAARLYKTLQMAVDTEIQSTGFVPDEAYGINPIASTAPKLNGARRDEPERPWRASDKQRDLILKLVHDNSVEMATVEELALEMFETGDLPSLNKIQASGLIDELLTRYGKKNRRETAPTPAWKARAR
jgi:hypothetical protein